MIDIEKIIPKTAFQVIKNEFETYLPMKENVLEELKIIEQALEELEQLKKKATPMKVDKEIETVLYYHNRPPQKHYDCPSCNVFITIDEYYCPDCGQALDWSDEV